MKRNYLILTVFGIVSVLFIQIGCQEQNDVASASELKLAASEPTADSAETKITKSEPEVGTPKIKFEQLTYDFGTVGPAGTNICEFKFTNVGDGLLKIKKIQKTCGCTPFTLKKKKYEPGESGTLKVKYYASSRPGPATRYLYVYTNDEKNPKVKLTIKAKIVLKVSCKPKDMNLSLKKKNAGCPQIILESLDGKPFSIKQFKSIGDSITVEFDPSVEAKKFVLEPKVDMKKLRKRLNGRIDISLTHPQCKTVTTRFSTLPEFKADPPSLAVFNAEQQKPVTKEVWILSNYNEDFEIESVSAKKNIIKVLSQEKIGKRYKFKLQITPPTVEDKKRFFNDVLFVNIKGGVKLMINCNGFYPKQAVESDSSQADKS